MKRVDPVAYSYISGPGQQASDQSYTARATQSTFQLYSIEIPIKVREAPRRREVNPGDSKLAPELVQCLISEHQKFTPLDVRQGLVCETVFSQATSAIFESNQSTVVDIGLLCPLLCMAALRELLEDCRARRAVVNHRPLRRFQ